MANTWILSEQNKRELVNLKKTCQGYYSLDIYNKIEYIIDNIITKNIIIKSEINNLYILLQIKNAQIENETTNDFDYWESQNELKQSNDDIENEELNKRNLTRLNNQLAIKQINDYKKWLMSFRYMKNEKAIRNQNIKYRTI